MCHYLRRWVCLMSFELDGTVKEKLNLEIKYKVDGPSYKNRIGIVSKQCLWRHTIQGAFNHCLVRRHSFLRRPPSFCKGDVLPCELWVVCASVVTLRGRAQASPCRVQSSLLALVESHIWLKLHLVSMSLPYPFSHSLQSLSSACLLWCQTGIIMVT